MKMKQIVFVGDTGKNDPKALVTQLGDQYAIWTPKWNIEEAVELLDRDSDNIAAVIVAYPSEHPEVERLLSYMKENNTVIFAIPALVLTDHEHISEDLKYLKDPVVDVIRLTDSIQVVKNRVERASQFVNSVSFAEFARMLRVLPSLIYLKDAKGRYVFCTQYWHHLEHYDDPDWTIRGKTDMEIRKDTENARRAYESDLRMLKSGVGTSYIIEENDGPEKEYLQIIKEPLKYEDGRIRGIIALINNVTEQETLKRKLEKLSFTDELTGLYNRAYADAYIRTVSEMDYPLSIISADCDHLKQINDSYGHMVGDEYIRMSVILMRSTLPKDSVICRMGGDEFLIFLPNTEKSRMEDLIRQLNEKAGIFRIQDRQLSVSFGGETIEGKGLSVSEAIEHSDEEMYSRKRERESKE